MQTMGYDPNWFYSSLAQSAAALVGLLGAILTSRLQQQLSAVKASYDDVAKLIRSLRDTVRAQIDSTRSYITFADERIAQIESALQQGHDKLAVRSEIHFGGGSSGGTWTIDISPTVLARYANLRRIADPFIEILRQHQDAATVEDAQSVSASLSQLETLLPTEDRHVLAGLRDALRAIEVANRQHLATAAIRVPFAITMILAWICISGLLVPLTYLTAFGTASKNLLLLAFGVGVIAIPGYMSFELIRIQRLKRVRAGSAT